MFKVNSKKKRTASFLLLNLNIYPTFLQCSYCWLRPMTFISVIEITVGHEIRRSDRSLNETIWATNCDKLHVLDMIKEMKRKKFVHWVLSLHTTKFYEAEVNSLCISKLFIKINIVQPQLWEKSIHKLLSCFRKQHVLSRLFTRIFFLGKKGANQASQNNSFRPQLTPNINALTHVSFITSSINAQPAITCSKLTIETLEQGVKYVQS